MKVEQPAGIAETVEHGVDLNVRVSRKKPGFVFFEDADDLRFGKSRLLHGLSPSRPLALESPPISGALIGLHVKCGGGI